MGDKSDGFMRALPKFEQLFIQMVPHDLIQRPERFIHQEDICIKSQGPGDGSALLHPA